MTSELPKWNPANPDWASQEALTMDSRGRVHDVEHIMATRRRFINLVSTSELAVNFTTNDHFHSALRAHVNVSQVKTKNGHCAIIYEKLVDKWLVLLEVAKHTLEQTTQRGVRTIFHPYLAH